jgi:hypothetical protein
VCKDSLTLYSIILKAVTVNKQRFTVAFLFGLLQNILRSHWFHNCYCQPYQLIKIKYSFSTWLLVLQTDNYINYSLKLKSVLLEPAILLLFLLWTGIAQGVPYTATIYDILRVPI